MREPSDSNRGRSPSRLVRITPPFVGRRQEMAWLARSLQEAVAGHPRVVLIEGEAGIGKTRLLQEIRSIAQRLHMQVCFGRCYEDLTLPYLPFIESLLPELEKLADTKQITEGAFEVITRLLRRGEAPATPGATAPGQADQDKLQLFLAVGRGTINLAQRRPILFVVDDLHWADRLSLDLFEHTALTVADAAVQEPVPLVIIGTYRPMAAGERLPRLTARLQRERICRSFTLLGLNESEIDELIGGLGPLRPSHQLTATVSEATQGNPLFIQEVLHHLVRQDALRGRGGYLVATMAASDLGLPDQLTGAIFARAQGLSEGCRRVLTLASFLGDSFSLEAVGAVSGVPEEELLDVLEEGSRQRLLRSEGKSFQFAHSLIRHVFYHEPSAARRERIHKQIAKSLQRLYAHSGETHLLEIAHHLVRAGSSAPAEVVVDYARRAADQAFSLFAWSEAAHYYEAALSAAESTGHLSTPERGNLHYWAGLAHSHDQDVGPCIHHYDKALEAYRLTGDIRGLAQTLMERTRILTLTAVPLGALGDIEPLEDALTALGDGEPELQGHISAVIAEAYRNSRQPDKAKQKARRAVEIGRALQNNYLCAYASFALALADANDLRISEALDGFHCARAYARQANDLIREGWALHRIPLPLTLLGRMDDAEVVATEACELTRRSHDWSNHSIGLSHLATVAAARGDFGAAEQRAHETMLMVSRSHYPWGGLRSLLALACARTLRGAWAEADDSLNALVEPGRVFREVGPVIEAFVRVFRRLVRARSGVADGALEQLGADLMRLAGTDTYSLAPLCALVELGQLAAAPTITELPYQALSRAANRGVVFSSGWVFLVPRVLANADTVKQRWNEADARFRAAIDLAAGADARPELGRTYLDYARMLIVRGDPGDRPRAIELVSRAASIFAELRTPTFIRDTAELAEALGAPTPTALELRAEYPDDLSEREVQVLVRMAQGRTGPQIASDLVLGPNTVADHVGSIFGKIRASDALAATAYAVEKGLTSAVEVESGVAERRPQALRTILVTDVVASTALIHRSGDAAAHHLIQTHNELIRNCLDAHDGLEVTHTGDGIEASFTSASSAVQCAIAIQQAFARHNAEHAAQAIHVRIGLNAGEPILTEGALFGIAVNTAFRICERAQPGQILVSDVIRHLVAGKGFALTSRGRAAIRGVPGRIHLYEVSWERGPAQ